MYETYMASGEESTKYQELVEGRAEHARKLLTYTLYAQNWIALSTETEDEIRQYQSSKFDQLSPLWEEELIVS